MRAPNQSTRTKRGAPIRRRQDRRKRWCCETPLSATLSNGLQVILIERHAVPIVAANLVFKNGSDSNPADKPGLAAFTAAMIDEGTATRNALQIADDVARLGASLGTGSGVDSSNVTARALTRNFAPTMDILADVVLHPSFPAQELERQRTSRIAQLAPGERRPARHRAAGDLGGPVWLEPSVRPSRDRHRGIAQGDEPRRPGRRSGGRTTSRTTPP